MSRWFQTIMPLGIAALLLSVVVIGSGSVLAGKGGNGNGRFALGAGESSIVLNESDPHLGGPATFTSTYPSGTHNPRIDVMCYDLSGALVYGEAGGVDHQFVLGGYASVWVTNGGPAHCFARLFDLIWNGNNPQEVVWLAFAEFDASA